MNVHKLLRSLLEKASTQPLPRGRGSVTWCKHSSEFRSRARKQAVFRVFQQALRLVLVVSAVSAQAPVEAVRVVTRGMERRVKLPGEFQPYLAVPIHAKVTGFVDKVEVDRGSDVQKGQVLAVVVAPEMEAHIAEAQSKVQAVE